MAPAAWRAYQLIHDDELWLKYCLSGLVLASLLWNSMVFVVPQVCPCPSLEPRPLPRRPCALCVRPCASLGIHRVRQPNQYTTHSPLLPATLHPVAWSGRPQVSRKRFSDFFVVCLSTLDGAAMMGSSMAVITLGG